MARSTFRALLTIAGLLAASPALAQFPNIFDSIFGNPPQRPPADVPSRPPSPSPRQPQYLPPPGGGGLPPGPPPGSRIRTEPLPPPPGAGSAPAAASRAATAAPGAPPGAPPASSRSSRRRLGPPPNNETIVEPPPNKIANPTAVFSGLDKITGRIISFDVAINETVRFGALEVTPRACYSRPPTEAPTTDGFIEVDELTLQGEIKRIFSGWMFAASPGLNAVEHPIYDVWLTDCKGAPQPAVAEAPPAPAPPQRAPQRAQQPRAAPDQPQQRATQQLPPPARAAAGALISSLAGLSSAHPAACSVMQRFRAAHVPASAAKSASPTKRCFEQLVILRDATLRPRRTSSDDP